MGLNFAHNPIRLEGLQKAYNDLDKWTGGVLPGGAAVKQVGNEAVLNGKPVIYDGRDWVSPENFKKLQNTGELKKRRTEAVSKIGDRHRDKLRAIGTKAVRNGKPVLWAGPDLAWQSPETFKKLQTEGYKGNPDYLSKGGVSGHRARLARNEGLKIASPVLEPIATAAGDQYEQFKKGNPLGAWYLESVGQGVGWGLNKIEQGTTALSRAAGVDPFWGNTAIETIADVVTGPFIPTTALALAGKVETGGDIAANLRRINRLKKRGKLTGSQINAAITPEGVLNRYGVYRKNRITGKKERVPLPDESALPTLGRKDQHHWIPKDTRHDFTQQANKLDPKGQAALDAIDVEYGLQAGGGEKGVTTMDMGAHLPLHGRIRSAGYELSGTQLKAFKKEIAGIKDIEQLKVVYRDWLEKNVIPTLNTVTALQGGYELLEASGGKVTKEALLNAAYGRGGWMDRQLSVVENRIDAAIQAGRTPRRADILFKARAEQDALNNLF